MINSGQAETEFRQSRIYAEGWNAARKSAGAAPKARAPRNPYPTGPEGARWLEGFTAGSA